MSGKERYHPPLMGKGAFQTTLLFSKADCYFKPVPHPQEECAMSLWKLKSLFNLFRQPAMTNRRSRKPRLGLESLEDRCVPANFTVTDLGDAGAGTLRAAIT